MSDPPVLRRNTTGILGGVPMSAADSMHQRIIDRLDFESYKDLVRGLTQFGDREQGTPRNEAAIDWIEERLQSWGYETERLDYEYTPRVRRGDPPLPPEPRQEVYATKVGTTNPGEMYIVSGHMDGRGRGEAANDDGSGTALVMEIARVLAEDDVETDRSIRFALWNNEETGLNGSRAYVEQRAALQGIEDPPGSGRYPEPRWLGMIQHDMMMWDHGNPVQYDQALDADVDVEYQLNSEMADESALLGLVLINANRLHASDYPAVLSNAMSNTDSTPFMDLVPSVSLRENRRLYETGNRANPHWHQTTDLFETFSDADFALGLNAAQTTLGALTKLAGIRLVE
ncbi:MAG: M20/M25/M40 family metallo-hydrolase [Gemmatimonadota bacterium]